MEKPTDVTRRVFEAFTLFGIKPPDSDAKSKTPLINVGIKDSNISFTVKLNSGIEPTKENGFDTIYQNFDAFSFLALLDQLKDLALNGVKGEKRKIVNYTFKYVDNVRTDEKIKTSDFIFGKNVETGVVWFSLVVAGKNKIKFELKFSDFHVCVDSSVNPLSDEESSKIKTLSWVEGLRNTVITNIGYYSPKYEFKQGEQTTTKAKSSVSDLDDLEDIPY